MLYSPAISAFPYTETLPPFCVTVAFSSMTRLPSILTSAVPPMISWEPSSIVSVTPSSMLNCPIMVTLELFLMVSESTTVTFSSCP